MLHYFVWLSLLDYSANNTISTSIVKEDEER
jgi:hypothetical protein